MCLNTIPPYGDGTTTSKVLPSDGALSGQNGWQTTTLPQVAVGMSDGVKAVIGTVVGLIVVAAAALLAFFMLKKKQANKHFSTRAVATTAAVAASSEIVGHSDAAYVAQTNGQKLIETNNPYDGGVTLLN